MLVRCRVKFKRTEDNSNLGKFIVSKKNRMLLYCHSIHITHVTNHTPIVAYYHDNPTISYMAHVQG